MNSTNEGEHHVTLAKLIQGKFLSRKTYIFSQAFSLWGYFCDVMSGQSGDTKMPLQNLCKHRCCYSALLCVDQVPEGRCLCAG